MSSPCKRWWATGSWRWFSSRTSARVWLLLVLASRRRVNSFERHEGSLQHWAVLQSSTRHQVLEFLGVRIAFQADVPRKCSAPLFQRMSFCWFVCGYSPSRAFVCQGRLIDCPRSVPSWKTLSDTNVCSSAGMSNGKIDKNCFKLLFTRTHVFQAGLRVLGHVEERAEVCDRKRIRAEDLRQSLAIRWA